MSRRHEIIHKAASLPVGDPERKRLLARLKSGAQQDWKVEFPSHEVMRGGTLDKTYDKLNRYYNAMKRDRDPALKNHKKLMLEAVIKLSSARIALMRAEEALYY